MMNRAKTILILFALIFCYTRSHGLYTSGPTGTGPTIFNSSYFSNSLFVDDDFLLTDPELGITHFLTITDALLVAGTADVINIHNGTYAEQVTISLPVSLVAVSGEFPVMDGTGLTGSTAITVSATGVTIEGLMIRDYDNGITVSSAGNAEVYHCQVFDNLVYGMRNLNIVMESTATNCWWGASSGPLDPSDDRGTGGLYNPNGLGDNASDNIDYYPWSVNSTFTQLPVEFGIYSTSCGTLEVRLKPLSNVVSNTTIMQFTVRWTAGTVNLANINSPVYNLGLDNPVAVSGGYNYATFTSDDFTPVSWTAGTEVPVLTFEHDGSGTGFGNFEIILDSWTVANNADPYLELMGTDYSGVTYHMAENVYLDDCDNAELRVRAMLEGPYDSLTNLMKTDINSDIPLSQPYFLPPWSYSGTESLASAPEDMVDWVLIELRSTPSGPAVDRTAGIMMDNGQIMDAGLDGSIRFNGILASSPYYVVVHHRNHLPVMSKDPVIIPNINLFNFSDTLNFPPYGTGKKALSKIETGIYGLITGDINNDGKLKYSGAQNDRGLIMNMIYYETGSPVITQTIPGYFKEDLTMDHIVKYSGPNNDQREIILNLVELTGSTALNTVFPCVVPGYATSSYIPAGPPTAEMTSQLVDVGIFEYSAPDELVVKARPDHDIPGYGLTNIQFTIRWPSTSSVYQLWPTANTINSTFNIQPQGNVILADGYYHQVFAAANNALLTWAQGVEYPVLVLKYFYTIGDCTDFEITNDAWTVENNGTYYFEVLGQNRTGIMYQPLVQIVSEGGYVAGGQEICLGTSTGIMVLMNHSGTVTKWQRSLDNGAWADIPGTAGLTSYSESPSVTGTYEYRAEVQKFGCTPDFSDPAVISVVGNVLWTGNADSEWDDPVNWNSCGIPTLQMDVVIPNVSPKPFPYITVNAYCKSIVIKPGAIVWVTLSGSITVAGMTQMQGEELNDEVITNESDKFGH